MVWINSLRKPHPRHRWPPKRKAVSRIRYGRSDWRCRDRLAHRFGCASQISPSINFPIPPSLFAHVVETRDTRPVVAIRGKRRTCAAPIRCSGDSLPLEDGGTTMACRPPGRITSRVVLYVSARHASCGANTVLNIKLHRLTGSRREADICMSLISGESDAFLYSTAFTQGKASKNLVCVVDDLVADAPRTRDEDPLIDPAVPFISCLHG